MRAVASLDRYTAAGLPALRYPDNSIVCHANRLIGRKQDVFVGGAALAVNVDQGDSFFPDLYNEDWLFLAPHLDKRRVARVGAVTQRAYAPFADPDRARLQEFGDLVGEGLLSYLHEARLRPPPPVGYWRAFLAARTEFVARIRSACERMAPRDGRAIAALESLECADEARRAITPNDLVHYVITWLRDLRLWREYVRDLPRLGNLPAALQHLGLTTQPEASTEPQKHGDSVPRQTHHPQ
jgi:hypothetical protein